MARYLNMRDLMRTLSPDVTIVGGDAQLPQQAPTQPDTGALAARFENLWLLCGGPTLEREYRFHPVRKWRADYCHVATRILVELEGGLYGGGRHSRASGFLGDIEKYNAAAMLGYTVLRLGTGQVDREHVSQIVEFVKRKEVQG